MMCAVARPPSDGPCKIRNTAVLVHFLCFPPVVVVVVVVVLPLTRIVKSVVTGQAPVTLELRNTLGKNTNNPR